MTAELSPELLRRVLVTTGFEYTDQLFWREDNGLLTIYAECSDFFDWGCSDVEPIETEADVDMLEQCLIDLRAATGDRYPLWLTELYAARRRRRVPAPMMLGEGKYAMGAATEALFTAEALSVPEQEQP